jgi:hypothetical protein
MNSPAVAPADSSLVLSSADAKAKVGMLSRPIAALAAAGCVYIGMDHFV